MDQINCDRFIREGECRRLLGYPDLPAIVWRDREPSLGNISYLISEGL